MFWKSLIAYWCHARLRNGEALVQNLGVRDQLKKLLVALEPG